MAEKLAAGWSCGPVEDPDLREHPCLVTFLKLPPEQRLKVYLFLGVVHGLTALSMLPNPEVDVIDFGDGPPDSEAGAV